MSLARAALGLLALAVTLRAEDAHGDGSAAALEAEDTCLDPSDEACGLSLRQLRARQEAVASEDEPKALEASVERKSGHGGGGSASSSSHDHGGGYHNHISGRNIMTLYHQTSPAAGASILRSGFHLGTGHAICGSAIYFSPSVHDTEVKAIGGRGFIIEAQVDMGKVKRMGKECDWHMTGHKLAAMGYDSITLDRGGYKECWRTSHCLEFVIYDPRRILSMKGYKHHGWKHWYSPMAKVDGLPDESTADSPSLAQSNRSSPVEGIGS